MTVLLVCDRSGGHIFPALSLARKIAEHNKALSGVVTIFFFATSPFLKEYIVKEGFSVFGKVLTQRFIVFELILRFFEALYLLAILKPTRVIGFGGRDSIFLVLFASLVRCETSIYEPNVRLGKANRFLLPYVKKVLCGFKETLTDRKAVTVGIPLRPNIKRIEASVARAALGLDESPVLFCFGGSQGSQFLNAAFMRLLKKLTGAYQVIHLTGSKEYFSISTLYTTIEKRAFVKDFYYNMEVLYSACDCVICRAGAVTLAEVTYFQLPALLIPHPQAGGHQYDNACYLADRDAARIMTQDKFSDDAFCTQVHSLLFDTKLRKTLKDNLSKLPVGVMYEEFCENAHSEPW